LGHKVVSADLNAPTHFEVIEKRDFKQKCKPKYAKNALSFGEKT